MGHRKSDSKEPFMNSANATVPHISVCVCTYKRPLLLQRLLAELARQQTAGQFTFSAVVVDNDEQGSAKPAVEQCSSFVSFPICYCVEPRQNIALARNCAVENAQGDYIAFIDDDEFPETTWLLTLFKARSEYNVDGVLGPVKRHFDGQPPSWLLKSRFYDRPTYPTGLVIDWRKGRTGNVLLKREIFDTSAKPYFKPEFRQGEDQEFFSRMIAARARIRLV